MDVKAIRVVRRALETIIAYDTEYKCDLITHEPDYDHPIDGSCGLIARRALMALSTIDPEAIRAEARAEAAERLCNACLMKINLPCWKSPSCPYRASILADEPKEREAEPCSKCAERKGAPPCEFCGPPAWEAYQDNGDDRGEDEESLQEYLDRMDGYGIDGECGSRG